MRNETSVGSNRTGIKASPTEADELVEMQKLQPRVPPPAIGADAIRSEYAAEAESMGSVPPASSINGVFSNVVHAMSGHRISVLLDKLGERAAYERAGTRLYDAMLVKLASGADLPRGMSVAAVEKIRNEEARHFELLSDAIEQLGGDPTTLTPSADVAGVMASGLLQVMSDPRTSLAQCLQTLMAAELVDHASWELLIELCESFGLEQLRLRFAETLAIETQHVALVRGWLSSSLRHSALGRKH